MTDSRNFDEQFSVVEGLDHAVVANADAPLAVTAGGFWQPAGRGLEASIWRRDPTRATTSAGSFYSSRSALDVRTLDMSIRVGALV